MNTLSTHRSLHPMQWVAAIAVTIFAIVGVGAIIGVIPVAKSASPDVPPVPQPVAAATAAPAATVPAPAPIVVVNTVKTPLRHHHSTTLASNEQPPPSSAVPADYTPPPAPAVCADCGRIESVQRIVHEGEGSGLGAVAGGVLGGALGNGVGQGNGRKITTIAGMIGGALLSNHVEKSQKQSVTWQTVVRFDDGTSRVINSATEPSWQNGERVKLVNGNIQPAA